MSGMIRATIGLVFGGSRRAGRREPAWRAGEQVLIVACDRRTGRPERPGISMEAVVVEVNEVYVTVSVGEGRSARSYDFFADGGWDAYPSRVTPWRIFREEDRWRVFNETDPWRP